MERGWIQMTPRTDFPARRLLLGVTGAISAVMVPPSITIMRSIFGVQEVRVLLTARAATILAPEALAALSGQPTLLDWPDPWQRAACSTRQVGRHIPGHAGYGKHTCQGRTWNRR